MDEFDNLGMLEDILEQDLVYLWRDLINKREEKDWLYSIDSIPISFNSE